MAQLNGYLTDRKVNKHSLYHSRETSRDSRSGFELRRSFSKVSNVSFGPSAMTGRVSNKDPPLKVAFVNMEEESSHDSSSQQSETIMTKVASSQSPDKRRARSRSSSRGIPKMKAHNIPEDVRTESLMVEAHGPVLLSLKSSEVIREPSPKFQANQAMM